MNKIKNLTVIATVIGAGIFLLEGCEKATMTSCNNNSIISENQSTIQSTNFYDYDIDYLVTLPEFNSYAHNFSNMLSAFIYDFEANELYCGQINNLCQNITSTNDSDEINTYYSELVQMIIPGEYLEIITNNGQSFYCLHADSLNISFQNLISSINDEYPEFDDMSEDFKLQLIAKMFEKNFYEGNSIGGPLEDERDEKLALAAIIYASSLAAASFTPIWPILFATATTVYCRQVQQAWHEYYRDGGTEPKGTSCKICEA